VFYSFHPSDQPASVQAVATAQACAPALLLDSHCEHVGSGAPPLELHSAQVAAGSAMLKRALRTLVDQEAAPRHFGMRFESSRQVNGFASPSVSGALLCAGVACHDITSGNTDADSDFRLFNSTAFLVELLDQLDHFKSRSDRAGSAIV